MWIAVAPAVSDPANTTRSGAIPNGERSGPEHVRVTPVVGLERQPAVKRRDRRQEASHEPPATDEHLGSAAQHEPLAQVGATGREDVSAAELGPDLGVVRDVASQGLLRQAKQVAEQPSELDR